MAILQDGVAYLDEFFVTPSSTAWLTRSRAGLGASNFGVFDIGSGVNGIDFSQGPDLSASGSPIQLGFVTWLRCSGCSSSFTSETGYDNFSVTVIPEPSAAILIGLGLLGLGQRAHSKTEVDPVRSKA